MKIKLFSGQFRIFGLFVVISVAVVLFWIFYSGDKGLEGLFSGLAFAGVIVTLIMQMNELTLSRKEYERSASAQEKSQIALHEQMVSMRLTSKIELMRDYLLDDAIKEVDKKDVAERIVQKEIEKLLFFPEHYYALAPRFEVKEFADQDPEKMRSSSNGFHFSISNIGTPCRIDLYDDPLGDIFECEELFDPTDFSKIIDTATVFNVVLNKMDKPAEFHIITHDVLKGYRWKQTFHIDPTAIFFPIKDKCPEPERIDSIDHGIILPKYKGN